MILRESIEIHNITKHRNQKLSAHIKANHNLLFVIDMVDFVNFNSLINFNLIH